MFSFSLMKCCFWQTSKHLSVYSYHILKEVSMVTLSVAATLIVNIKVVCFQAEVFQSSPFRC